MPAKNTIRYFIENNYYHLYNRGVDKRDIFIDKNDYQTFLSLLKTYLSPPTQKTLPKTVQRSLSKEAILLAYCLLPNHYHLLVKLKRIQGITKLMRAINTNYVMYFNNKYKRIGPLFQGKYRAVRIESDEQLLHLSRYIHLNPISIQKYNQDLIEYPYSSYKYYLNEKNTSWLKTKYLLNYFYSNTSSSNQSSYKSFTENNSQKTATFLQKITLE